MADKKKIAYLSGGRMVPTVLFRTPFFDLLEQRGHRCDLLHSYPSRYDLYRPIGWRFSDRLQKLVRSHHCRRIKRKRYDSVVLETELFSTNDWRYEAKVRNNASRFVYDIGDAVFLQFPEKTQKIAEFADHVIAGNRRIADWATQHNSSVSIIPTCVDATIYTARQHDELSDLTEPVVGWIGSSGNVRMLSVCADALRTVANERRFQFRVITSDARSLNGMHLEGVDVRWVDINKCNVVSQLQELDIGIMPLPSNVPWMEFKGNAKMIQYMATGIPAIGSAIGFNLELVDHGINSMLAANTDEWIECLNQLLESSELRFRIGAGARNTAMEKYTVQSNIAAYESAILGTD